MGERSEERRVRRVRFDRPLRDPEALFTWLAWRFQLPDYFGRNWDALEECLQDLSWWPEVERVELVFDELPLAERPEELCIWRSIVDALVARPAGAPGPSWTAEVAERWREAWESAAE